MGDKKAKKAGGTTKESKGSGKDVKYQEVRPEDFDQSQESVSENMQTPSCPFMHDQVAQTAADKAADTSESQLFTIVTEPELDAQVLTRNKLKEFHSAQSNASTSMLSSPCMSDPKTHDSYLSNTTTLNSVDLHDSADTSDQAAPNATGPPPKKPLFGPLYDIPNDPTIKDLMTMIVGQHSETSAVLLKIDQRIDDYEVSLDFAHSKITENTNNISQLRTENKELRQLIGSLSSSLGSVNVELKAVRERQDKAERRSREWGIRVHGVREGARENTRTVLSKLISHHKLAGLDNPSRASQAIEHCHRLGESAPGKPRAIIANLFSRPVRNQLLKDARAINIQGGLYFSEDLIKSDHDAKLKARRQMKQAYEAGHKVMFRKGQLIIDSNVVPIEDPPNEDGNDGDTDD